MKVLFQPIYLQTPHFETELEIIENHLSQGDEAHVLACRGDLGTCYANPHHLRSKCYLCKQTLQKGLGVFGDRITIHEYSSVGSIPDPEIPAFSDVAKLMQYEESGYQYGMAAASSLITAIGRDHEFDTIRHHQRIVTEIATGRMIRGTLESLFARIPFDRMYIFNGRFSTALPAVNFCEIHNIPYRTHERGGKLTTYCTCDNSIFSNLEYVCQEIHDVWNANTEEASRAMGVTFFVDRRNRVEHSWYSFTKRQKIARLPDGFDPSKKNITIFNSTIEEFSANRHWTDLWGVFSSEPDAIDSICGHLSQHAEFHVYLRVHPNLQGCESTQIRAIREVSRRHKNLTVIAPESKIDSYALMDASHCVLTFGSTMGAEATYWGKPSIVLGHAFYESLDCCYIPSSQDELFRWLQADLEAKPRAGALRYGCWDLSRGHAFQHYQPTRLRTGRFMGTDISPTRSQLLCARLLQTLEPSMYPSLFQRIRSRWS